MAYSVTKAGVIHLTKTASHYLSGTNIRVNCICPGVIATKLTTDVIGRPDMNQAEKDFTDARVWSAFRNPMMRYGSVDEISNVALFLSSNLSTFVNGQAIAVDGGQTAMYTSCVGRETAQLVFKTVIVYTCVNVKTAYFS